MKGQLSTPNMPIMIKILKSHATASFYSCESALNCRHASLLMGERVRSNAMKGEFNSEMII